MVTEAWVQTQLVQRHPFQGWKPIVRWQITGSSVSWPTKTLLQGRPSMNSLPLLCTAMPTLKTESPGDADHSPCAGHYNVLGEGPWSSTWTCDVMHIKSQCGVRFLLPPQGIVTVHTRSLSGSSATHLHKVCALHIANPWELLNNHCLREG